MGLFEDELRKAQQFRAQQNAIAQAQQAELDYNNRLANANAQAQQAQNADPGGLAGVLAGIGNSIKNVGDTLYNMGGTGIASIRDIFTGNAGTGKYQKEWDQYAKENIYGNKDMSDKDYHLKTGGKALDAAATVSDFIPGVGGAAKVALNVGQGVASGVAQNYIDNGENATIEDSLKGGLIGGASAGVGQYVGGKLAGKKAGKGIISKALNSQVGKGAITGAASGATGAGLASALNGGNLGEVLGSAAQGAGGGALGGGAMAGVMGLAGTGLEKLNNKVLGVDADTATPVAKAVEPVQDIDGDAKATGWGEKDMTGTAKKRNALQKFGDTLKETGQMTEDSGVYSKLKGNTAEDMAQKNSVQRLRDIGFEPSDYDQAANLSEVANKAYSDAVGKSKKTTSLPSVYQLSDDIADDLNMSSAQKEVLKRDISTRLDAVRKSGTGSMYSFDAQGLEDVADALGKKAKKMTTTSEGGSKANNGTLSPDDAKYAQALNEIKKALRGEVNDMVTDVNLAKDVKAKLKAAGATDQQIKYLTQDGNLSGLKARTSLLEDARTMSRQMKSDKLKRGANATNSTSLGTQIANATGASGVLDVATGPVRKIVGKVEKGVGSVIGAAGDMAAGKAGTKVAGVAKNVANTAGKVTGALNNDFVANRAFGGSDLGLPSAAELVTAQTARQAGKAEAGQVNARRDIQNAQQEMQNAQTDYTNAMAQAQTAYNNAQMAQVSQGQEQLDRIANAMQMALNAGDITAYSQLMDLYQQAYKIYGADLTAGTGTATAEKLTDNQAKALTGMQQLEQLSSMKPGTGTALAGSPLGGVVNMFGGDQYANQAQSLALTLGYLQSGANVSQSEAQKIGESYIPTAFDSEQTRQQKLDRARQLLNNYLYGTQYYQG